MFCNILQSPTHGDVGKPMVECNLCKKRYSYTGSTSRMIEHLTKQHDILNSTSDQYQKYALASQSIRNRIIELLALMIVTSGHSFSTVENEHLRELVNYLLSLASLRIQMPSRKLIASTVHQLASEKKKLAINKLSKASNISVTVDGWTSTKQHIGYIGATAHFFDRFQLDSLSLGVRKIEGPHTASNVADTIKKILCDYNIFQKVKSMVGDNGPNMSAAAAILKIPFFSCFAHTLNLIVKSI